MKIYNQETKKLQKHPDDLRDVIESEKKLQNLGHVDFVKNLPNHIQHAVWKPNSIPTPCRVVFGTSSLTDSGYSLNSILAKGTNGRNKLVEIMIRWYTHKSAFHTDVTKMYNTIKLREDQWYFQRYLLYGATLSM